MKQATNTVSENLTIKEAMKVLEDKLLTHKEALTILRITRNTLYKIREAGESKTVKVRRKVLISEASLKNYVKAQTR